MHDKPAILIVDDEPRMCDSLKVLLDNEGYVTQIADSGRKALEGLSSGSIDLVLLDIVMPDMSGLEIMDFIRENGLETLVIVITGHASMDSAIESLRKGAHDYLKKPFEFDELLKRVENALEQKRLKKDYEILNGKLALSERRYQALVDNSPDIIYTLDMDGKITFVNRAWEKVMGHDIHQVVGKRLEDFAGGDLGLDYTTILAKNPLNESFGDNTFTLLHKDGSSRLFSISGAPNTDSNGTTIGMVGVLKDITEQRKLEAQLTQAHKMQAIGTLAGGIAHDFNNLLMGIQGRTSLMFLNIDPNVPHYEHLKGIENIVESGANLTKQLLGFARSGKYEVKPTNINTLVEKSVQMFARTKKEISIHTDFEKKIWTLELDQGQLEQVILNICVNACHAMPKGGELYLKTRNIVLEQQDTLPFGLNPGQYVRISMKDTGVGMDDMTQRRIFEPFFTTKEMGRGTGLGLASAYGIIKNHGGIIEVDSKKGEGSTFTIYLPASSELVAEDRKMPTEIKRGTESVLLVDDEEMIIEVGQEILKEMGYKVFLARTGKEAVEVYAKNKDEIDMVILDMIMPDMGGGEAFDKIKEIQPDAKVLLSSGYSVEGQASEILARGCNGFIQKPFTLKKLSETIRSVLDS